MGRQLTKLGQPFRQELTRSLGLSLGYPLTEWRIGPMVYRLKLLHQMKQLHPVFNIVKLTPALDNPITGCKMEDHLLPIVIDGKAEWEVEEILDSCWHQRRFQYLIKQKEYGHEHNSWESASKVSTPELTAELQDMFDMRSSTTSFTPSPLL